MLTRNSLKALGIEGEKIEAIIEGHVESVNGLKSEADKLKAELDEAKGAIGERDKFKADLDKANERIKSLEAKSSNNGELVTERDQLKTEVDNLKAEIEKFTHEREDSNTELTSLREKLATFESEKASLTESATKAQKELEDFKTQIETEKANNVKKNALRTTLSANGVVRSEFQDLIINATNLDDIKVGDNGIENVETLIESTKAKYPGCFGVVQEVGTPPVNPLNGAPSRPLTRADISKMTPEQINKAWASGEIQKALASTN